MLTVREAMIRLNENNMGMKMFGSLQWQIFYREDKNHQHSRLVDYDSLEDVVLTAGRMRAERNAEELGDITFIRGKGYVTC